jgi:putative tryptophan/tyrosine transport system ATP-binding protein
VKAPDSTVSQEDHVTIVGLCLSYERWGQRVKALDNVTLSVPRGQWLVLVGHNGSGKSSLLRVLSGLEKFESGRVTLDGRPVTDLTGRKLAETVFLVHQNPLRGTVEDLTVFENLMVGDWQGQAGHHSKQSLFVKYEEMLRPLGLETRMKQPVHTLSGGERQLLALLVARLRPCPLILLDEPTGALDPQKAERCLAEIAHLVKSGKTIIHVTHDSALATSIGDRTVALRKGAIVYDMKGSERLGSSLSTHWS